MMQCMSALFAVNLSDEIRFLQDMCLVFKQTSQSKRIMCPTWCKWITESFFKFSISLIFYPWIFLSSSPSPLSRQRPSSPATPKGRTASPSPAASPKPPSTRGSPSTPKGRPKRARTPARIDHRTSSPVPLERVKEPRRPTTPEQRKSEYNRMKLLWLAVQNKVQLVSNFLHSDDSHYQTFP